MLCNELGPDAERFSRSGAKPTAASSLGVDGRPTLPLVTADLGAAAVAKAASAAADIYSISASQCITVQCGAINISTWLCSLTLDIVGGIRTRGRKV